ncbi:hypothetical protein VNO77_19417 [Canavalia gladiata]|uniref:Uncharacterized protein n=1 Tax=Canavalia gladiata TaxID=3824 RepID=A0AAN9LNB6_CANGL
MLALWNASLMLSSTRLGDFHAIRFHFAFRPKGLAYHVISIRDHQYIVSKLMGWGSNYMKHKTQRGVAKTRACYVYGGRSSYRNNAQGETRWSSKGAGPEVQIKSPLHLVIQLQPEGAEGTLAKDVVRGGYEDVHSVFGVTMNERWLEKRRDDQVLSRLTFLGSSLSISLKAPPSQKDALDIWRETHSHQEQLGADIQWYTSYGIRAPAKETTVQGMRGP